MLFSLYIKIVCSLVFFPTQDMCKEEVKACYKKHKELEGEKLDKKTILRLCIGDYRYDQ